MKVEALLSSVEAEVELRKTVKARNLLFQKLQNIERTKKILKEMKADLEKFKQMDVEDIDLCDCRY